VSSWSLGAVYRPSWRDVGRRNLQMVLAIVAGLAGTSAFLLWGPIGIGNGPLQAGGSGGEFGGVGGEAPLAISVPLSNTGGHATVIDSIELTGRGSYPAPRVLAAEAMSSSEVDCPDMAPVNLGPAGFTVSAGCSGRSLGQLTGLSVRPGAAPMAAFAVRAPGPGRCWLLTDVVVNYHVGFRYYTGPYPDVIADCGPRGSWPAEDTAEQISDAASP
jgi:hypothetical protein